MDSEGEGAVRKILDAYRAAVYAKDVDAFMAIYDEDVVVFDMWGPGWMHQGAASWRGMVEGWFGGLNDERVVVDVENVLVRETAEMGFVSAFVKYSAVSSDGKVLRWLQNRLTCVLEVKGGVWKITHQHTSSPVDHATLKVSLKR